MVIHLALCEFDVFVLSIYSSIAEEEKTFIKQNLTMSLDEPVNQVQRNGSNF